MASPIRFQTPMSSELRTGRAYRLGRCESGVVTCRPGCCNIGARGPQPRCRADRHSLDKRRHEPGGARRDPALVLASILRRMRQLYKFEVTFLRRRPQPQPKSVVELLGISSISSAATSERCPELDEALRRFLDAQRARETQAEQAHELASKFVRVHANSQERQAAAITIAGAYDKARSLTQTELDLMVAEIIVRIPDNAERRKELQYSHEEYENFGIPGDYIRAAARWRQVVEFERSRSSMHGVDDGCWADVYGGKREDRACEAEPDPKSALGLCAGHEAQIMEPAYGREVSNKTRPNRAAARSLAIGVGPVRHHGI